MKHFNPPIGVSVFLFTLLLTGTAAASEGGVGATGMTERMAHLMLQLAAIICAAKIAGWLCSRYLRIPSVLGELLSGIIIGPYALGPMLHLFSVPAGNGFPVSPELYGIATLASILLLYLAGLETDLPMFVRYSLVGSAVGVGGVVISFAFGDLVAVWWGLADSWLDPNALFLGTISTATSVGITARIMSERNQLDSPEGVTILAGAVIDDVLGMIVLAVVLGIGSVAQSGGSIPWGSVGLLAGKALGFWIGCTVVGLLAAKRVGRVLEFFGSREIMASISLGLALLLAGLAEQAGLAMIIGAYIMGLSFSRVDFANELRHRLEPMYATLVSVFFCVMGMMVNIQAMGGVLAFALVYSAIAIVAKVAGCGLPTLFMRFNRLGALRVGIGMLPRGEVALIVAGIGLSSGLIGQDIFGVSVFMTLITTVMAPLIMVHIFDDRPGHADTTEEQRALPPITFSLPGEEAASFVLARILELFEQEECYIYQLSPSDPIHQIRKDDITITARRDKNTLVLHASDEEDYEYARLMALEALAGLIHMLENLRQISSNQDLRSQILASETST